MNRSIFAVLVLSVVVSGCASTSHNSTLVEQLQLKVGELEREVQLKDEQINNLKYDMKDLAYEVERLKTTKRKKTKLRESVSKAGTSSSTKEEGIIRVDASTQKIQSALKSAGYYNGSIDGKVGARTKTAISKFQSDHGLKADGIVGRKTWNELQSYLD